VTSWFNGEAFADFNGDGTIGIDDLFGYLNAWIAGCP
jgi:hypothetical protein